MRISKRDFVGVTAVLMMVLIFAAIATTASAREDIPKWAQYSELRIAELGIVQEETGCQFFSTLSEKHSHYVHLQQNGIGDNSRVRGMERWLLDVFDMDIAEVEKIEARLCQSNLNQPL